MSTEALNWLLVAFCCFALGLTFCFVVLWVGVLLLGAGVGALCAWEAER
jgi:uncharacterized membrane protein SpoIIM required for sporulation